MVNLGFSLVNFEYFLLILVRITTFIYAAPLFGQSGVPNQVKIGLSFLLSAMLFPIVEHPALEYADVIGYAVYVLIEGITGLLIGFSASICNSIVLFAGNIIDMDIGLSMATEFNPEMNNEVTITGDLYYYLMLLMLIGSNMHMYVIRAICDSFQVVPIGGASFQWDDLLGAMTKYMGDLFVIGFRIFLPIFACIMILNCILGIMAKVAPQMNMFAIGVQLKMLVGMSVMFLTIFMLPNIADFIYSEMKTMVGLIINGLQGG
jgi:flagellar biosynthetic protein FliR